MRQNTRTYTCKSNQRNSCRKCVYCRKIKLISNIEDLWYTYTKAEDLIKASIRRIGATLALVYVLCISFFEMNDASPFGSFFFLRMYSWGTLVQGGPRERRVNGVKRVYPCVVHCYLEYNTNVHKKKKKSLKLLAQLS